MNKVLMGAAVLVSGLLFCCPQVNAADELRPKAGFTEWESEIECKPVSYILTDEQKDKVKRIGVLEGGGEDAEAIAHVIQVVMNRVASDKFPNTVEEVIFQKNPTQFCTAKRLAKADVTEAADEALEAVIKGEYKSNEALYFESLPGKTWEKIHTYLFSYEGHDFYK